MFWHFYHRYPRSLISLNSVARMCLPSDRMYKLSYQLFIELIGSDAYFQIQNSDFHWIYFYEVGSNEHNLDLEPRELKAFINDLSLYRATCQLSLSLQCKNLDFSALQRFQSIKTYSWIILWFCSKYLSSSITA